MRGSIRTGSIAAGRESARSYASSNAIPIGIPDYYLTNRDGIPSLPGADRPISGPDSTYSDSIYDAPPPPPLHVGHGTGKEERQDEAAGEAEREDPSPEPATLVRQASLGRKSKPTLTTVRSGERIRKGVSNEGISTLPSQQRGAVSPMEVLPLTPHGSELPLDSSPPSKRSLDSGKDDKGFKATAVAMPVPAHFNRSRENLSTRTPSSDDVLASGTGLIDPSSSESEKEIKKKRSKELLNVPMPMAEPKQTQARDPSPLGKEVEVDPRFSEILGGLQKGGAIRPQEPDKLKVPTPGFSERVGRRRPPRLNVDAVREAEARGSLTSLPDLIKRATRLASNLDRGKTASRLGMNWIDGMAENDGEKHRSGITGDRNSGSISDILASFPPPGLATPPGSRGEMRRTVPNWSRGWRHSHHLPSESDAGDGRLQKRKRCCGMPLWLFLLLLLLVILLIAAAIIVPVVLIVVPKQDGSGSTGNKAVSECASKLTCQNGGANVITVSGTCQCVCVNGYTGSTCETASGAGCTTTSVGSTTNATVGDEIPRLISDAKTNFSVPLDGEALLGLFSAANLDCATENALVTFSSSAKRRALEPEEPETPTRVLRARDTTTSSVDHATTSNGIIYEIGTPNAPACTSHTSTATSSSATASPTSSSSNSSATRTMEFARTAVLYVFQTSGKLGSASTAQTSLQDYFDNSTNASSANSTSVSLGNGYTCDLKAFSIELANGTTVGGSGTTS
jgi:hypothetical protein